MKSQRSLQTLLCLLVMLSTTLAEGAFNGATAGIVPSELAAEAANHGAVRVIVELQSVPVVPEAALAHPAAVTAQRTAIARLQAVARTSLQGTTHLVRHQYTTIPYLALDAGPDALRALDSMPGVVSAVFEDQLFEPHLQQSVPLIHADQMHALGYDGTGWVVAIVDTGVSWGNPFLNRGIVYGACFASGSDPGFPFGNCPGGLKSVVGSIYAGLPCGESPPSATTFLPCSHGTHVAGIAVGDGSPPANVLPRTGVAPRAQFMGILVFSNFNSVPLAIESDIIAALEHVLSKSQAPAPTGDHSFNVAAVNLSLGGNQRNGSGYSSHCDTRHPAMAAAISQLRAAGIATVVSTGNNGFVNATSAPACVSGAVSVSSTGDGGPERPLAPLDQISNFSNIASFVSLLAPGQWITSVVPTYDPSSNRLGEGVGYGTIAGTSMSAPHVSGALAVLKQAHPDASVDTLVEALQLTGVPITDRRPAGHVKGQPAAPGSITIPRIDLAAAMFADLTVVDAATDVKVAAGNTVSVSYSIRNQGGQPAGDSVVGFALVPVTAAGVPAGGDVSLPTTQTVPGLAGATATAFTTIVTIPGTTPPGTYRIRVIADVTGVVAESDETNNGMLTAGVLNVSLADLAVSSVTFGPAAVAPGFNVSVVHTLKNVAASLVTAPPSVSGVYLARNASFSSIVARIGGVAAPAIAGGAPVTIPTRGFTVPTGTAPGRYVVLVRANDSGAFAETAAGNNVGVSATSLIVGADLLPTVATTAGGSVPGTNVSVTWVVKNQGGASAAGFHIGFKLVAVDPGGVPIGDGVDLGAAPGPFTLGVGGVTAATRTTVTIPVSTVPGGYRIAVMADALREIADADFTNNVRLTSGILRIALPDFVVPSVDFTPAASLVGGNVTVTHTVRNLGVAPATAPASISRLLLSTNASVSGQIADLGTVAVAAIAPLGSVRARSVVALPAVAPGVYFVLARANDGNAVVEASTDNNLGISTGRLVVGPDLIVSAATVPARASSGTNVSATFTLKNAGGDVARASTVRFALVPVDSAGLPVGEDIPLAPDRNVASLGAGGSITLTHRVLIPPGTPSGFVRIKLTADAADDVVEADETNNTRLTGLVKIAPEMSRHHP